MSSIDKLVTEIRLAAIENEHKTVGARLDRRQLQDLEPVAMKHSKKKKSKRTVELVPISSPVAEPNTSGGNAAEGGTGISAGGANSPKDDSSSVESLQSVSELYKNELVLWRTKQANPSYTLKRRFKNPKLQEALDNFGEVQRAHYRQKVKEEVINLSSKLRKQFFGAQRDMDYTGVFHPAANAQRVQTQYLAKLYRKISADTIEDPAIEFVQGEEDRKRKEIEADEARTNALLMKYNQGLKPNTSSEADGNVQSGTVQTTEAAKDEEAESVGLGGENVQKEEETEMEKEKEMEKRKEKQEIPVVSAPSSPAKVTPTSRRKTVDEGQQQQQVNGGKVDVLGTGATVDMPGRSPMARKQSNVDTVGSMGSSDVLPGNKRDEKGGDFLDKLKVKRVKIGTTAPQEILEDETRRLNDGTSMSKAAEKERQLSDMMNEEATSWMTTSMHRSVVKKTGRGLSLPDVLTGPLTKEDVPIVPFDEFMQLLSSHVHDSAGMMSVAGAETSDVGSCAESKSSLGIASIDRNPAGAGLTINTSGDISAGALERPVPMNAVKLLSEEDDGFKQFLKISQSRPAAKVMTKQVSRLTDKMAKRTRKQSAVGLEAVLSKTSSAAQRNPFLPLVENDDDAQVGLEGAEITKEETKRDDDGGGGGGGSESGEGVSGVYRDNVFGGGSSSENSSPRNPSVSGDSVGGRVNATRTGTNHDDLERSFDSDLLFQGKLDESWVILRTSAVKRLEFMRKYCQPEFAKRFPVAIEATGELAILTHGFMSVMKVWNMNKKEQVVFPTSIDKVVRYVSDRHFTYLLGEGTSDAAEARRFVVSRVAAAFDDVGILEATHVGELKDVLRVVLTHVSERILKKIEALSDDLDEDVFVGTTALADYVKTNLKSTLPPPADGTEGKGGSKGKK